MELTLTIPDDVASEIQNGSKMPCRAEYWNWRRFKPMNPTSLRNGM